MVEQLLNLLICVVDKQLLQGIVWKDFKPGNIQHTDEQCLRLKMIEIHVHLSHQPEEESVVKGHGQGIPRRRCPLFVPFDLHFLPSHPNVRANDGTFQLLWVNTQKGGRVLQCNQRP